MEIKRDIYLNEIIDKMGNGFVKIITGIRRCGKSYLLNELFYNYLLSQNTPEDHIIKIAFDDRINEKLKVADVALEYFRGQIKDGEKYYFLLDEIQMMNEFVSVLNSLLHIKNADVYVTGSNSRFLSKDILTEFRGRGDQIHIMPLSFSEFYASCDMDKSDAWAEYYTFGGMPQILQMKTDKQKTDYLVNLFKETYIKDMIERNNIKNDYELEELINILSSAIGSLTNPNKLENVFKSEKKVDISGNTIKKYLDCLEESFLINKAVRYDIKGKKYINTPYKYYFSDVGLRNARLSFRQQEENHIMENIIYNELLIRGYNIDVGVVEINEKNLSGSYIKKQLEVDFVANYGSKRYYIQSAFALPTTSKIEQEQKSLVKINDSFKKIVVVKDNIKLKRDEKGMVTIGLFEFLLDKNSLEL